MQLTNDHITYILKDLHYRGIVHEGLEEELVDHICSSVEEQMEKGIRFIDAYHSVLKKFGHTEGLRQTQHQSVGLAWSGKNASGTTHGQFIG